MKLFFRYLGMAFEDFFAHILLAFKYFFKNLFRAFWHPKRKQDSKDSWPTRHFNKPKFISPESNDKPKKRRHRGGKRHRGGRKHRHHKNDAPET